jgi:RNA polymerase sigma-70 factor (ECF subfamily)
VRAWYDEILRYVRRQTPDTWVALDLTQEIFISMLRTIGSYDRRRAGFRTWLYAIATNKVIDWYRSRAARVLDVADLEGHDPVLADPTDDWVQGVSSGEAVQRLLGVLPGAAQKIVRLHVFGEQTFAEIAKGMSMSENTAKTTYYRALRRLRKEIDDE